MVVCLYFAGKNSSAQLDGVCAQLDDAAVANNSLGPQDSIRVDESHRGSYVFRPVALS